MTGSRWRAALVAVVAVGLVGALPGAATGWTPSPLTGIALIRNVVAGPPTGGECVTDPTDGSISYEFDTSGTVADLVAGQAAGTFTERVEVTINAPGAPIPIGPFDFGPSGVDPSSQVPAGQLIQFDAVFSMAIDGNTTVTGTKRLATTSTIATAYGTCAEFAGAFNSGRYKSAWVSTLEYNAIISSPSGIYVDEGTSSARARESWVLDPDGLTVSNVSEFLEKFVSTNFRLASGKSTGGGQTADGATFGFNAKADLSGTSGTCTVVDHAGTTVKCLDVTAYDQNGDVATFSGSAEVDGVVTSYTAEVADHGEPGAGVDSFTIETPLGSFGGTLAKGNVQVHS